MSSEKENKMEKEKTLANLLDEINKNYTNYEVRYSLCLRASAIAMELKYVTGFRHDPDEKDWPVLVIILPEIGEVSWHMPPVGVEYDHHTRYESKERIRKYILLQKNA